MIESGTVANLNECTFKNLHSNETAAAMTVNEALANINSTIFQDNTAAVGLFQVSSSTLTIYDTSFRDNFAEQVTNGFSVTESDFKISNSYITNKGGAPSRRRLKQRRVRRRRLQDTGDDTSIDNAVYGVDVLAGFFYVSSRSDF